MISLSQIQSELAALEKQYDKIQRGLRALPKERMYVRKSRGRNRFYTMPCDENGMRREKYLAANSASFRQLARVLYLSKLEKIVSGEIGLLSRFIKEYTPHEKYDLYKSLPGEIQDCVETVFKTNEQLIEEWLQEEFSANEMPNREEGLYITKRGENVRSRIELIVASELHDLGIPYRYECALDLSSRRIYPDFTVLHPETLEPWYIEVFGMMGDPDYVASNMKKIQEYYDNGLQGRLIAFYDHPEAHLAVPMVRNVLKELFVNVD